MRKLIFILGLFLASGAENTFAYQSGHAPFCLMDDYGNLECYYHTMSACQQALEFKVLGSWYCVHK